MLRLRPAGESVEVFVRPAAVSIGAMASRAKLCKAVSAFVRPFPLVARVIPARQLRLVEIYA